MIEVPQLWLPDRLRERREDERLLPPGRTRRWMPGNPCCCYSARVANCIDTCALVDINGADYVCQDGKDAPPIYITDHTWRLSPPGGLSSSVPCLTCTWSYGVKSAVPLGEETNLNFFYSFKITEEEVEEELVYHATLNVRMSKDVWDGPRDIVFQQTYSEHPLCEITESGEQLILRKQLTLPFLSDTGGFDGTTFWDNGQPYFYGTDFSNAEATVELRASLDCGYPISWDLHSPYCPIGETPFGFYVRIIWEEDGDNYDETWFLPSLWGAFNTPGRSWRVSSMGGLTDPRPPGLSDLNVVLRCDGDGNLYWHIFAYSTPAGWYAGRGTVDGACDIEGVHQVLDWAGTGEWGDWEVYIEPVGPYGYGLAAAPLLGKSDLGAEATHDFTLAAASLNGRSDLAVAATNAATTATAALLGKSDLGAAASDTEPE